MLAFEGWDGQNNKRIFLVNNDGSNLIQLTAGPGDDIAPEWEK
jgi:hypothetical protein